MTTDIKELVKRLRAWSRDVIGADATFADAASALEAMAGEVAGLKEAHAAELKLCDEELFRVNKQWSDMCKRAEAAEAERDRLKAELKTASQLLHDTAVRESRLKAALEEIKTKAPKSSPEMNDDYGGNFDDAWSGGWDSGFNAAANIARKALGGDAS